MIGQKKYINFTEVYRKLYPELQNGKKNRYGQEFWLKVKKDQDQYENTPIELKGRAAKFINPV